jgi:putative peptidoglycan lipid II flippase
VSIGSGHGPAEREAETEKRLGKVWVLALVGIIGAFAVLACYDLISSAGELTAGAGAVAVKAVTPSVSRAATAPHPTVAPSGPASVSQPGTPGSSAPQPLAVTAVAAFGPDGTADGDNPGVASRILDASTAQPWYSQWYATPEFGHLRSGTGLLLTLGEGATVSDVRLVLGSTPGADIQVRVGDDPSPDLPVVASASDVGGTVRLGLTTPVTARYVLIWFTRLPPDGHGHYQVSVYSVQVDG